MASRTLQVVIAGDASSVNRAFRSVDTHAKSTEANTKKHLAGVATAFKTAGVAAAGGIVIGLKKSADAAIEAEKSQARMVTQLKAAGVSYKAHATQIDEVIQKTSKLSGLDDEDLQDSFTNIVRVTGDVNKSLKLTGLAADFARAKHMDVAKAGELVGKVAGGNTGILSRYGIQIDKGATATEALGVLQKKFGGQAEAYGKTTAGSLDRASVAGENLGEIVGAKVTPILAKVAIGFVDLIDKTGQLAGPIRTVTGFFKDHTTTTTILASVIGGLATAFGVYKVAVLTASAASKVAAVSTALLNAVMAANPIGLVVLAIAGLTAGLVIAYKRSETFRKIVDGAFKAVSGAASTLAHAVVDAFNWIKRLPGRVAGVFNDVKDSITKRFNAIVNGAERIGRGILNAVVNFVKKLPGRIFDLYVTVAKTIVGFEVRMYTAAWNVGKKIVGGVVGFVTKLPGRVWDLFVGLLRQIGRLERQGAEAALNVGKKIVGGVIDGIGNIGHKIVDKIKGGVDWAVDKLKDIGKKLNPFGDGIGRVSGDGIGRTVGAALPTGGKGALMGADPELQPFANIAAGFGLSTTSGIRPGAITSSGNPSYHGTGNAIDESGPPSAMLRFFQAMKSNFGSRLRELIYTPGGVGIKDGRPFRYTGQVAADHFDHVHVAYTGPFGDGPGRRKGDGIGQIENLWVRAGGRKGAAAIAAAVAMAESSGRAGVTHRNSDGSVDRGLWQINSVHGRLSTTDRIGNARAAVRISGNGRNWRPWTTFTSGAYRKYLAAAQKAAAGLSGGGGAAGVVMGQVLGPAGPSLGSVSGASYGSGIYALPGVKRAPKASASSGDGGDPNQALIDSNERLAEALAAAAQAEAERKAALAELAAEMKATREYATSVQNTESNVLKRTLADLLSGQLAGPGVASRRLTPGYGVQWRY